MDGGEVEPEVEMAVWGSRKREVDMEVGEVGKEVDMEGGK